MQQKTMQVSDEVVAVVDGLKKEAGDIAAKSPLATELADAIPVVMTVLGSSAALAVDWKSADNLAYLVQQLLPIVLPAPAPAA